LWLQQRKLYPTNIQETSVEDWLKIEEFSSGKKKENIGKTIYCHNRIKGSSIPQWKRQVWYWRRENQLRIIQANISWLLTKYNENTNSLKVWFSIKLAGIKWMERPWSERKLSAHGIRSSTHYSSFSVKTLDWIQVVWKNKALA